MNPFDPELFAESIGCLPCCPEAGCPCALILPPPGFSDPPFATLTEAQDANANNAFDCIVFAAVPAVYSLGDPMTDIAVSVDTSTPGEVEIVTTVSASMLAILFNELSFTVGAAGTLSIDFVYTGTPDYDPFGRRMQLISCDTREILDDQENDSSTSGTVTLTVPAAGTYYVKMLSRLNVTGSATNTFTASYTSDIVYNPVVSYWDDSGTTRQLEACPKFYDPDGSGGTVYASLADAEYIRDFGTASCIAIGPTSDNPQRLSFGATDFGTSLLISAAMDNSLNPANAPAWVASAGINLEAGDTLSAAWVISSTGDTGVMQTAVSLYRLNESLVYELVETKYGNPVGSSDSGTITFSIDIPGNYRVIYAAVGMIDSMTTASVISTITYSSSGAFSVNPVEYLYGCGLDCPCALPCP